MPIIVLCPKRARLGLGDGGTLRAELPAGMGGDEATRAADRERADLPLEVQELADGHALLPETFPGMGAEHRNLGHVGVADSDGAEHVEDPWELPASGVDAPARHAVGGIGQEVEGAWIARGDPRLGRLEVGASRITGVEPAASRHETPILQAPRESAAQAAWR